MAATTTLESNSAAQRRLAKELATLGRSIEKEQVGPKRLELLREQAAVSDKLEALRSTRVRLRSPSRYSARRNSRAPCPTQAGFLAPAVVAVRLLPRTQFTR